jgi:hypothetical protein
VISSFDYPLRAPLAQAGWSAHIYRFLKINSEEKFTLKSADLVANIFPHS